MAFARVVTFDGVNKARMDEAKRQMEESGRPDDVPGSEIVVLHDPEAESSLVIISLSRRTTIAAATTL